MLSSGKNLIPPTMTPIPVAGCTSVTAIGIKASAAAYLLADIYFQKKGTPVGKSAGAALRKMGTDAIAALSRRLDDKNWLTRRVAAWKLMEFGAEAFIAVPMIDEMCDDDPDEACFRLRDHAKGMILKDVW